MAAYYFWYLIIWEDALLSWKAGYPMISGSIYSKIYTISPLKLSFLGRWINEFAGVHNFLSLTTIIEVNNLIL